jgi:hypothetical protein
MSITIRRQSGFQEQKIPLEFPTGFISAAPFDKLRKRLI